MTKKETDNNNSIRARSAGTGEKKQLLKKKKTETQKTKSQAAKQGTKGTKAGQELKEEKPKKGGRRSGGANRGAGRRTGSKKPAAKIAELQRAELLKAGYEEMMEPESLKDYENEGSGFTVTEKAREFLKLRQAQINELSEPVLRQKRLNHERTVEAVERYRERTAAMEDRKTVLIRTDGIKINKLYTLSDQNVDESVRGSSNYTANIRIKLDKEYTDKDGKKYNNFGTYLMRKYYENPSYFKDSYTFIHNLVPGYYFKIQSGLGSMAYIRTSQLNVYFRFLKNDSVVVGASSFVGTEEVIQSTRIANDANTLKRLL